MMAPASGYRTCRTQHHSCHSSEAHRNSSRTRCRNDDGAASGKRRRNFSARCPSSERGRSQRLLICTASVYKVIRTAAVAIHWMPFFIFVKHCGCPVGIAFFCSTRTLWLHSRAHFFNVYVLRFRRTLKVEIGGGALSLIFIVRKLEASSDPLRYALNAEMFLRENRWADLNELCCILDKS